MQYRKFGKLDWNVSALGFGAMRLPMLAGAKDDKGFDEKESIRIIRRAIDNGVNYIDTAYVYHGGLSEVLVGKALKDGYREKTKIATKLPMWIVKGTGDFDRLLNEQLKRLDTGHIDFYLFHGLAKWSWSRTLELGLLKKAESAVKDGRISHIGFSFHDNYGTFREIVDGYDRWEFCQIQYNYMDTENQATQKGLEYAASKGLAVIVMEPLLGGRLANPPAPVRELFDNYKVKRTPADWALQWIWNRPEVSMILSGMSNMEQVEQNLASAGRSKVNSFGPDEEALIKAVAAAFRSRADIPCTKCNYCLPCPAGVNIPRNFELYNEGLVYGDLAGARIGYNRFFSEKERANLCTACKECEEKCPQKIKIGGLMPKVHSVLGEGKEY